MFHHERQGARSDDRRCRNPADDRRCSCPVPRAHGFPATNRMYVIPEVPVHDKRCRSRACGKQCSCRAPPAHDFPPRNHYGNSEPFPNDRNYTPPVHDKPCSGRSLRFHAHQSTGTYESAALPANDRKCRRLPHDRPCILLCSIQQRHHAHPVAIGCYEKRAA